MFYYLNGELILAEENTCVVDCNGIGYKLTVSHLTSSKLSESLGEKVKIYTHLAVREDGVELFGFISTAEKNAFNMLIGVSGVGPKAAINILSIMTSDELAIAICSDNVKSISKAQNIGSKTASRIILELKDKVAKDYVPEKTASPSNVSKTIKDSANILEAREALAVLGYDKSSISRVLEGIDPTVDVSVIIREALKKLSR